MSKSSAKGTAWPIQEMPETHLGNSPPLQVHGLQLLGVLRGEHGRPDLGVSVVGDIVPGCEPLPIFRHHLQGQRVGTLNNQPIWEQGKVRGGGKEALKRSLFSFSPKRGGRFARKEMRPSLLFHEPGQSFYQAAFSLSKRVFFSFLSFSSFSLSLFLSFIKQASECSWAKTEEWIASYWEQSLEPQPVKREKSKAILTGMRINKADV